MYVERQDPISLPLLMPGANWIVQEVSAPAEDSHGPCCVPLGLLHCIRRDLDNSPCECFRSLSFLTQTPGGSTAAWSMCIVRLQGGARRVDASCLILVQGQQHCSEP
eukprot:1140292-Pelagomonas_calceolata.AAC.1